jgi:PAS domain S-box-containing protein
MKSVAQSRLQKTLADRLGFSMGGFIIIVCAALLILMTGLWLIYKMQTENIFQRRASDLQTIAELKTDQLEYWFQEQLNHTEFYASELFPDLLSQTQIIPANLASDKELIRTATLLVQTEDFENIMLAAVNNELLFSLNPEITQLNPEAIQLVNKARQSGQVEYSDIYRSQDSDNLYLDFAAKLKLADPSTELVLIMRLSAEKQLFPMIQTWPSYSQSAETLLVRREEDQVVFLNVLRQDPSPALSIKIPLSKTEVPAVQAVLGNIGTTEGKDYRGVEVIAVILPVEDTNWYLITKEDKAEMLTSTHLVAVYLGVILLLIIAMTIILAAYRSNFLQKNLYLDLLNSKAQQLIVQEEIRTTLYSIGDGVISTDADGMITRMNLVAEQLTGWQEKDAIGKPLHTVFQIINESTRLEVENPVVHVIREGVVVGLANHTLLIAKDGKERPIADSGAPIRNEKKQIIGVVLVFRDQTQEKEHQREMALLTDTISASLNEIYIFDAKTLHFRFANAGALQNLGYNLDEIKTMTPLDLKPTLNQESFRILIEPLIRNEKKLLIFETIHRRANGTIYPVEVHLQLFHHQVDDVFLAVIKDITERNQAQEKLQHAEQRYHQLFNQMEEGFALHEIIRNEEGKPIDYIFLDVNPAFEILTDTKKESLLGKRVLETFPMTEPFWIETYGKVALEGIAIKFENYHEGLKKWFSVSAFSPKPSHFACIFTEITDQKVFEKNLKASEERFRFLFDHMAHGVVYQNADGVITLANQAAQEILGLSMEQMQGRSSLDPEWRAIHEDHTPFPGETHPSIQSIKTGRVIRDITMGVYNPKIGEYTWININSVPQFRPGEEKPFASFTTFEDITKRKLAEDKLKQQIIELRRWNTVTLGRETRILELKNEVNQLLMESGKPARYNSVKEPNSDD